MLDPMTAIGLTGNIVQFIDFSVKLVGKAHEIHISVDGALAENLDAETVARTLRMLQSKLKIDETHNTSYDSDMEGLLEGLCESCNGVAEELLDILERFKAQGKKTVWKSTRHAIKNVKGKATVLEILARLSEFRNLLDTTILVGLRKTIDLHLVANSTSFKTLETSTQNIILAINENRSAFASVIETKTAELKALQRDEAVLSTDRHEAVKATITATVIETKEQHEITRRDIAIRAANEAASMKAHMDKRTDEIKDLIKATHQAKGKAERKRLMEKTNAATASLIAMDLIYNNLIGILAQTDINYGRHLWKLSPSDYRQHAENVLPPRAELGLSNSRTMTDMPSSRSVSMSPKLQPFEYLPEVQPETPNPKVGPYNISTDEHSSVDHSLTNHSANSRKNDDSSRTDFEINTPQPGMRFHTENTFRNIGANTAGLCPKHSAKQSMVCDLDHDNDGYVGYSQLQEAQSPSLFATTVPNLTSPSNVRSGYGDDHPAPINHFDPGVMTYHPMNDTPQQVHPGYHSPMPPGMPGLGYAGYYPRPLPPLDSDLGGDPELEMKLLAVEELMKAQKLDFEKVQKELAARDAAEKAAKQKEEADAIAAKNAAEERATWEERLRKERERADEEIAALEKKFEKEKIAAMSRVAEKTKKQMEAERKRAEEEEQKQREIAAAVQAARDELLAEKRAEEESRGKSSIILWPSLWKR